LIDNQWKLSPAYDILPSIGFNGYHTTTINGKGEPTMTDILTIANEVGLHKQRVSQIIDDIVTICNKEKMLKYTPKTS